MKHTHFTILAVVFFYGTLAAQSNNFILDIQPVTVDGFTGWQSGAAAADAEGNILLLAGRTDGLHKRQPFASFLPAGANPEIMVLHPESGQQWTAPITALSADLQAQLLATNPEFIQENGLLYMIGGYGYNPALDNHTTAALLTIIQVDSLIAAVKNGTDITPWFQSVSDDRLSVTGGYLGYLDGVFYLAGGQKFEGQYNPMNHPTFTQTYTDAIRRFTVENTGGQIVLTFLPEWTDPAQLHRRDYNMASQIFPNGQRGFTLFSGVFQQTVDLPFLNTVDVVPSGYTANNTFQHRLNQYHCAHLALFDSLNNEMNTVFLGGIAQYYFGTDNQLVQDDNVPFVTTIGRVTRQANGAMEETKIGDLPAYLGAGAEFVPLPALVGDDHLFRLDLLGDTVHLGYLAGGIKSEGQNIFFQNTNLSTASNGLFSVTLLRVDSPSGVVVPVIPSVTGSFTMQPNPVVDFTEAVFTLLQPAQTSIMLQAPDGRLIVAEDLGNLDAGEHHFQFKLQQFPAGVYPVTLTTGQEMHTIQIVIVPGQK